MRSKMSRLARYYFAGLYTRVSLDWTRVKLSHLICTQHGRINSWRAGDTPIHWSKAIFGGPRSMCLVASAVPEVGRVWPGPSRAHAKALGAQTKRLDTSKLKPLCN